MTDYMELVSELRESAKWADRLAVLMGRDVGDSKSPLMRKAADAIEELLAVVPHWISVEERLPEVEQSVLFCVFGRSVGEGTYRGHDGFHHVWKMYAVAGTYWDNEVTHWMPLPTPPKEVE